MKTLNTLNSNQLEDLARATYKQYKQIIQLQLLITKREIAAQAAKAEEDNNLQDDIQELFQNELPGVLPTGSFIEKLVSTVSKSLPNEE